MSEYWFFKDAPQKLYIRKEVKTPIDEGDQDMADQETDRKEDMDINGNHVDAVVEKPKKPQKFTTSYSWHYYDREEQVEELLNCLNIKGQREKKLQENLRKVSDRLKLKKAKKVNPLKVEATKDKVTEGGVSEKVDETKSEQVDNTDHGLTTPKNATEGPEKTDEARPTDMTTEGNPDEPSSQNNQQ